MAYNFIPGVTLQGDLSEALQFNDLYTIDKRLRSGSYGTVYVTRHKESGEEFAVKVIDRRYVSRIATRNSRPRILPISCMHNAYYVLTQFLPLKQTEEEV